MHRKTRVRATQIRAFERSWYVRLVYAGTGSCSQESWEGAAALALPIRITSKLSGVILSV